MYLSGETATSVPAPGAPVEPSSTGVLGRLGLFLALRHGIPPATAWEAAEGWDGDRYILWQGGTGPCLRVTAANESVGDANELAAVLQAWTATRVDARFESVDGVKRHLLLVRLT